MQRKTEVYRRRLRFQCMIFCTLLLVGCARIHVLEMPSPDGNSATYEKADPPALESCEQTVEKLPILPGEPEETELFVIHSGQPGPCIFVVGGIHGDETAGWMAAERLQNQAVLTIRNALHPFTRKSYRCTGAATLCRQLWRPQSCFPRREFLR